MSFLPFCVTVLHASLGIVRKKNLFLHNHTGCRRKIPCFVHFNCCRQVVWFTKPNFRYCRLGGSMSLHHVLFHTWAAPNLVCLWPCGRGGIEGLSGAVSSSECQYWVVVVVPAVIRSEYEYRVVVSISVSRIEYRVVASVEWQRSGATEARVLWWWAAALCSLAGGYSCYKRWAWLSPSSVLWTTPIWQDSWLVLFQIKSISGL